MSRMDQKLETRQRLLEGIGRGFRRSGFGGIGVDGLAQEAGVTSGAFYKYFDSKSDAFREAIVDGMLRLKEGVLRFQKQHGKQWWEQFVPFYLHERRTCDLSASCVLPSLTEEVVRSDESSRVAFETELREIAAIVASGPKSPDAPDDVESAYASLATLLGGVTLARAVSDPELAGSIASSVERALLPHRRK